MVPRVAIKYKKATNLLINTLLSIKPKNIAMKKFLFLFLSIIFSNLLVAQTRVFPFKKNGKWGIIDENQKVIKEPSFDHISFFLNHNSENAICHAIHNSKGGLLNRDGKILIPFEYDRIYIFKSFNAASVSINKKSGVFNLKEGKLSIPIIYNYVISQEDGRYFKLNKMNIFGISDLNHNIIVPIKYSSIEIIKQKDDSINFYAALNNSITVYDEKGDILNSYTKEEKIDNGIKEFFIDEDEEVDDIKPIKLDFTKLEKEVKLIYTIENKKTGKRIGLVRQKGYYGLIDEKCNLLTPIQYRKIKDDRNESGLFLYGKNRLWGWFSFSENKIILQTEYERIEPAFQPWSKYNLDKKFKNYLFLTTSENGLGVFFDTNTGQVFLPKE